jgi:hypothetical protein
MGLAVYYFFFLKSEEAFEEKKSGEREIELFMAQPKETQLAQAMPSQNTTAQPVQQHVRPQTGLLQHVHTQQVQSQHLQSQQALRVEQSDVHMRKLLRTAHSHLDNLECKEAYSYYLTIIDMVDSSDIERGHKQSINELYEKLTLLQKINAGHRSVDAKDRLRLRNIIGEVDRLAQKHLLSEQVRKHTEKSLQYFHDSLKNMHPNTYAYNRPLDGVGANSVPKRQRLSDGGQFTPYYSDS